MDPLKKRLHEERLRRMLPDGPHIVVKRSPEDAELLRRIRENPITYEELLALAKESTKKP